MELNGKEHREDNVYWKLSRNVRKRTFWHVRSLKTRISLCIRAVWLESSLSAWKNFAPLTIQNAHSEADWVHIDENVKKTKKQI